MSAGTCPVNAVGEEDTEDDEELVARYQSSTEGSWGSLTEVEGTKTTESTNLRERICKIETSASDGRVNHMDIQIKTHSKTSDESSNDELCNSVDGCGLNDSSDGEDE